MPPPFDQFFYFFVKYSLRSIRVQTEVYIFSGSRDATYKKTSVSDLPQLPRQGLKRYVCCL